MNTVNAGTAAWETLYEREYPRLLRALTAIAGDESAAEDAVQEAFVRGYKQGLEQVALRQLPERQRAVVVARYYYDLSYEEIAKAFAIRTGTVGATLSQAIGKLRAAQAARQLVRGAMRS
jgi:DNA-directed RNA polymerase specialized sigma24 family protein